MDYDSKVQALREAIKRLAGTPHGVTLSIMLSELEAKEPKQ